MYRAVTVSDVRTIVAAHSKRGTVRYSVPNLLLRVRVPAWRCRVLRKALADSLPVTTAYTVRPLSLRDHFKLRDVEVRP